jgi:chromosome segregation ATPase
VAPGGAVPTKPGRGEGAGSRAEGQGGRRLKAALAAKVAAVATAEEELRQERTAHHEAEGQLQQERVALADARSALEQERTALERTKKSLEERDAEVSRLDGELIALNISNADQ